MSIKILAIETSCDETSVAVVVDGLEVRSQVISSQIDLHQKFGGVVPEVASRKHLELINGITKEVLDKARLNFYDLDAVGVTYGPGLAGALLVGISVAKAISYALGIPLLAVNHLEGHLYANFLIEPFLSFPLVCLIVSGGHTDLVLIKHHGSFQLVGSTRDDAAGEAFDKIARALDLGYPGGPLIEKLSKKGNEEAIFFPRANVEGFDFSFSGLKTAVINFLRKTHQSGINKADVAASFQKAVIDALVDKTLQAAKKYQVKAILLGGGVAANFRLRESLKVSAAKSNYPLICPPAVLCTDNAAMIGCAAFYKYMRGDLAPLTLNAVPYLKLGEDQY